MNATLYPFQVERITFFENDPFMNLEVRFINDPLHFAGELVLNSSQLNQVLNAFITEGYDLTDRIVSTPSSSGNLFFEIDLRNESCLPIIDMPYLIVEQGTKQIRA